MVPHRAPHVKLVLNGSSSDATCKVITKWFLIERHMYCIVLYFYRRSQILLKNIHIKYLSAWHSPVRNQNILEIFKKAYVRSSTLMRWRSGPNFGVIQSSSSEKNYHPLNSKAKFYNMGNPIHFAKGAEFATSPYFNTTSFLNSVRSSWIPLLQI